MIYFYQILFVSIEFYYYNSFVVILYKLSSSTSERKDQFCQIYIKSHY